MATDVSFTPTTWVNAATPGISALELNRIETGVDDLATQFSAHNGGTGTSDHPVATTGVRGFMSSGDKTKLNNIETSATQDQTAAQILTKLLTVDGAASGLDADLLDGVQGGSYVRSDATDIVTTLLFANGSASAPSVAASADTNTGLAWSGSGSTAQMLHYINTALQLSISGTGFTTAPIRAANGGYGFISDTGVKYATNGSAVAEIEANSVVSIRVGASSINCRVTDLLTLGSSGVRWTEVWATDGSINTSDPASKSLIEDSDLGLAFVLAIRPTKFVRVGGTRPHYGFDAEQVHKAMKALNVADFAGYIDPKKGGYQPEGITKGGKPNRWEKHDSSWKLRGLRYSEFIAPAYAAISEIAARLEILEAA